MGGSVFLAEDDADADAEVMLRVGAEVGRVVVELDGAEVNARADAEVEAAADDSREAVVCVGKAGDAARVEARVLEADERVRERLDLRLRRVVLDLDAADERMKVNRGAVEVLSVKRVVALQPEVARTVRRAVRTKRGSSNISDAALRRCVPLPAHASVIENAPGVPPVV